MSHPKKLKQLAATAICGNDITSSCLYVSALTIMYAGQYAWISLCIVALVLFLFRKIYGEAVGALPLNGGAYNILLNTTSKSNASVAACLTILSYMATAVISASEGMHYLHSLVHGIDVTIATIVLLGLFLMLTILGISESAVVAIVIFVIHLATMAMLIFTGVWFVATHGMDIFHTNFKMPLKEGSITTALFFGFSTAMLGISGFESSANFVEEQDKGVFPKTLRNMWVAVSIINPLMALVVISVLPIGEVAGHKEALLSHLGKIAGGDGFGGTLSTIISIDAVLVLSGAVLTSYVGVSGLIKRMTLDRILPQVLLKETKKGSPWMILVIFFLLCLSVLFISSGDLEILAGVYTISFLSVMIYFGYGNFLLKIKRARLPRPEYAHPILVAIAVFALIVAIYGNIQMHPEYLVFFLKYFVPAMLVIYIFLRRNQMLQYLLVLANSFIDTLQKVAHKSRITLKRAIRKLSGQQFVYFTKGDDISVLNKVMIYVSQNEITRKLKIVTVVNEEQKISEQFMKDFEVLDRVYPEIKIEFIQIKGEFGPDLINNLSKEWNIPQNFMFISSPSDRFTHRLEDLGGVRLII